MAAVLAQHAAFSSPPITTSMAALQRSKNTVRSSLGRGPPAGAHRKLTHKTTLPAWAAAHRKLADVVLAQHLLGRAAVPNLLKLLRRVLACGGGRGTRTRHIRSHGHIFRGHSASPSGSQPSWRQSVAREASPGHPNRLQAAAAAVAHAAAPPSPRDRLRTRVGHERVKAAGVLIQEGGHIVHLRSAGNRSTRVQQRAGVAPDQTRQTADSSVVQGAAIATTPLLLQPAGSCTQRDSSPQAWPMHVHMMQERPYDAGAAPHSKPGAATLSLCASMLHRCRCAPCPR